MDIKIDLPDLDATKKLANKLAKELLPGITIFLIGDLGAGKTTLTRAILNALGYHEAIKSPTYTLVESYELPQFTIHHFDLYRLMDPSELEYIGIRDYVGPDTVCLFEWPQKGEGYLPPADLEINLSLHNDQRQAILSAKTPLGAAMLQGITG